MMQEPDFDEDDLINDYIEETYEEEDGLEPFPEELTVERNQQPPNNEEGVHHHRRHHPTHAPQTDQEETIRNEARERASEDAVTMPDETDHSSIDDDHDDDEEEEDDAATVRGRFSSARTKERLDLFSFDRYVNLSLFFYTNYEERN